MELLKIKAYQLFANYRKPMSFNFWDSYPLPPLSTVRGWFHTVVEAKDYIPMSMSIQGKFDSVVFDLQTVIKFNRTDRAKKGSTILEGFNKALTKSPTYVANIFNVNLTIYIKAPKEYLKTFKENVLKKEYPSLGRREDLLRVDFVDFVELQKEEILHFKPYRITEGIYLNKSTADNVGITGINYRMNFNYDKKANLRYFKKKDIVYVDSGYIDKGEFLFDKEEGRIVDLIGDEDE
ncbi:MAG: type I-B CRISPR-associated protein Cas5b [Minisyncoccia bacterium]